jgi:CRISPR-associated protein Csm1
MVCGDISGIQKFIYSISNKSAMKSLKGRSFYVQLLAETLCDELLDVCEASIINQVYAAGGKFYALLPNTKVVKEAIAKYQNEIQEKLWNDYNGKISLNIGYVAFGMQTNAQSFELEVTTNELPNSISIGDLWKLVADKTSQQKKIKYNNLIINQFDKLFKPSGQGGEVDICSIDGSEINGIPKKLENSFLKQGKEEKEELFISDKAFQQIKIGEQLYNAKYLVQTNNNNDSNFQIGLFSKFQILNESQQAHSISKWINIQFKNAPQFPDRTTENTAGFGFKYYGGIPMANNGKDIYTLQDICKIDITDEADDAKNTKLGILRMDVDNLGQLFMNGFSKKNQNGELNKANASFSKLATLSALLEQYFSGYLNTIRNSDLLFKSHTNIIYSGGDDVFAVGRWDVLINFAIAIRNNFTKFVCGRNDITLSAGLAIIGAKFPIAKAAELAGDAEKLAKNSFIDGQQKDAFALFDIVIQWQEMPIVAELKEDIIKWLQAKTISKGVIMKLFDYYNTYAKNQQLSNNQNPDLSWKWQATYNLARAAKECKTESGKLVYHELKNILFTQKYKNAHVRFEALIVACRWAELELKNTNN